MEKETFPIDANSLVSVIQCVEIRRAANGRFSLAITLSGDVFIDDHRTLAITDRTINARGTLKGRKPNPQWQRMRKASNES